MDSELNIAENNYLLGIQFHWHFHIAKIFLQWIPLWVQTLQSFFNQNTKRQVSKVASLGKGTFKKTKYGPFWRFLCRRLGRGGRCTDGHGGFLAGGGWRGQRDGGERGFHGCLDGGRWSRGLGAGHGDGGSSFLWPETNQPTNTLFLDLNVQSSTGSPKEQTEYALSGKGHFILNDKRAKVILCKNQQASQAQSVVFSGFK